MGLESIESIDGEEFGGKGVRLYARELERRAGGSLFSMQIESPVTGEENVHIADLREPVEKAEILSAFGRKLNEKSSIGNDSESKVV